MQDFTVNDKPAVKIFAKAIITAHSRNAILFDCEGDKVWLPKKCVKVINSETILIQEWIYKLKFE